jgi:uncharacterized protein involved in outer membrane biogenesis
MKFFLQLLLAIIVVIVALVLFAGGGLVKYIINVHGERLTGLEMSVAGAELNVLGGQLSMTNLAIANPAGYDNPNAAMVGSIQVNLRPKTLLQDVVVVDYVGIKGTRVVFEGDLNDNNIQDIQKILGARRGEVADHDHTEDEEAGRHPEEEQKRFAVRHLQVQDTAVAFKIGVPGMEGVTVPVSDIELTNIGTQEEGASAQEVVDQILLPLFDRIHRAALQAIQDPQGLLDRVKNSGFVKGIGEKLKNLF